VRRLTGAEKEACQRLDAIMKVRAGLLTVTEAAQFLNVSRKTYYEWEERALQAVTPALQNRPPGRPPTLEDPEKERLRREVADLQEDVEEMTQALRVIRVLRPLVLPPAPTRGSKKNGAQPERSC
jgi:transposase